jgi:methylmalonyl-CoA mutase N-terminal domain/subunit
MTINAPAALLLLLYQLVGEEQGVDPSKLTGTIQNDVLKEYIARGTYIYPPKAVAAADQRHLRLLPQGDPALEHDLHLRLPHGRGGATPAQEVAFTLANAREYVRPRWPAGLAVDDFAPRLSFFFVARTTLLEEVAKFRAARRIWAQVMRDEFDAQDPRSTMLRFHTQTAGVQLTAQQPEVNMVRVTVQALAAVLGGTQSLHTNSYDEAIALPTEKAARLALRTQQVIAYESDLTRPSTRSPGSYAVEAMTDELEAKIRELMDTVEELGGAVAAIEAGFQKREIEQSAYDVVRSVEDGSRTVVGVNRFRARPTRSTSHSRSTRPSRPSRPTGWPGCGPSATTPRSTGTSRPCGQRPRAPTTCCTRCTTRCGPAPRSARSATCSAPSGASTTPLTRSDSAATPPRNDHGSVIIAARPRRIQHGRCRPGAVRPGGSAGSPAVRSRGELVADRPIRGRAATGHRCPG